MRLTVLVSAASAPLAWLVFGRVVSRALEGSDERLKYRNNETVRVVEKDSGGGYFDFLWENDRLLNMLFLGTATYIIGNIADTWVTMLWEGIKKSVMMKVEFDSRDDAYRWVMEWLADNEYAQKHAGTWVAASNPSGTYGFKKGTSKEEERGSSSNVQMTPGTGTHWLSSDDGSKWVWVQRNVNSGAAKRLESIQVYMLGWNRAYMDNFINAMAEKCQEKDKSRTLIYMAEEYGNWSMARSRLRRPMNSLVLEKGVGEELVADIESFLANESWYSEHGIPWRRGYLLYGKPGCGKTSFITAVAGELGLNIYVISMSSAQLTDESLMSLMTSTPKNAVLLLEDIDVAFATSDGSQGTKGVTLSGVLNAIDGVGSQEGSVLFVTTNHVERLAEALVRPGRIDVRCEFKLATKDQIYRMFLRFFPAEEEAAREFQDLFGEGEKSMAAIQGLLMKHKDSPYSAIASAAAEEK